MAESTLRLHIAVPARVMRSPRRQRRVQVTALWPSLALLALLTIVAVLGERIAPYEPDAPSLTAALEPPLLFGGTLDHPLGTDGIGRDLLSRVIVGARISLLVGLSATLGAGLIGVALGLAAGYHGGTIGLVTSWLMDVQQALPFVIVAIGLVAVRGPSASMTILVLALTSWVAYARIVRLTTRALRNATFVEAAQVAGAGTRRVLARHVLPNVLPAVLVVGSQQAGAMLLYEAALSFLGLGVPSSSITWGGMVADGRETAVTAPWVSIVPGLAIVLVVLAFTSLADGLNRRFTERS